MYKKLHKQGEVGQVLLHCAFSCFFLTNFFFDKPATLNQELRSNAQCTNHHQLTASVLIKNIPHGIVCSLHTYRVFLSSSHTKHNKFRTRWEKYFFFPFVLFFCFFLSDMFCGPHMVAWKALMCQTHRKVGVQAAVCPLCLFTGSAAAAIGAFRCFSTNRKQGEGRMLFQ